MNPPVDRVFPALDALISGWPKNVRPNIIEVGKCWMGVNQKPMGDEPDEIVIADQHGSAIINPGAFPHALLHAPGIINTWTTWINDTSFRKQPVLALGAVITACGALIGRRLETEYGGRANIYALGLCETGGGKDRARLGVKEVLCAAGADALLGPEDLASEAGLVSSLVSNPTQLFQIDEIGKLLTAVSSPMAGQHLVGIVSALLKLYSSAGTVYKGKAYADTTKNPVIHQPHCCLYGTAVPEATWAALGTGALDDGLLARLWAFVTDDHKPAREKPVRTPPPTGLVEQIRAWHLSAPNGLASIMPTPATVHRTPEADEILSAFEARADVEETRLKGNPLAKLWTRASQKADQLSLIYAWSDHETPTIDAPAARWAVDLADYLTRSMLWHVQRHVAENRTEGEAKRVLRLIEDAGWEGITQNHLTRRTQWLPSRQRKEMMDGLMEADLVYSSTVQSHGRHALRYTLSRFKGGA